MPVRTGLTKSRDWGEELGRCDCAKRSGTQHLDWSDVHLNVLRIITFIGPPHLAHYGIHGFYDTWFTRDRHRLGFLKNTLSWPCWGDPTFTCSDVERAIKEQVRTRNYVALYEVKAAEELRTAEIAILARLEAKYRLPLEHPADATAKVLIGSEPPHP